ncbi:MAG: hypothetical protein IKZ22_07150 [Kiritimatiellae bacterium]|nr:hypothetical protein [Kiritimatiellia bacterium]
MKKALKIVCKTMKWGFIVFCFYLASLFFREERISGELIDSLASGWLPSNVVFHVDSVSVGFADGVKVRGLKIYDRNRADPLESVASADLIIVNCWQRRVTVVGARYLRLHDGYYETGNLERNARVDVKLPVIPEFRLVLERAHILGLKPRRVEATVSCTSGRLDAAKVLVEWPGGRQGSTVNGFCSVDIDNQRIYGEVKGFATQEDIRPLIVALDVPVALPYIDGFTGVVKPVPAFCSWDVNLVNNDFKLKLDLHPELGRYNGVPMRNADGIVELFVYTRGTNLNYRTQIGPLTAHDRAGNQLNGTIVIRGTNDVVRLEFDSVSRIGASALLDIVDYLNKGEMDWLRCETEPTVTVKGILAADYSHQDENDLHGHVEFRRGSILGVPMKDVKSDFSYVGDMVAFTNFSGRGKIGDRDGDVSGAFKMKVREGYEFPRDLNGKGSIRVENGCIVRMNLFMGLTDLMAEKIPGVGKIVEQTSVSADFTIENGVVKSDNVRIEGKLFSIKMRGRYDAVKDDLDFNVQVQFFKQDSIVGKILRPFTWAVSELLLDFRLTGSLENPKWSYKHVLDKVMEVGK